MFSIEVIMPLGTDGIHAKVLFLKHKPNKDRLTITIKHNYVTKGLVEVTEQKNNCGAGYGDFL